MLTTIPTPITITQNEVEAEIHFIPSTTNWGYHLGFITPTSITILSDERDEPLHFPAIYEAAEWVANII